MGKQYADPLLMEEDMEEFGYIDSTTTMIHEVIPKTGKPLLFKTNAEGFAGLEALKARTFTARRATGASPGFVRGYVLR